MGRENSIYEKLGHHERTRQVEERGWTGRCARVLGDVGAGDMPPIGFGR